MAEAPVKGAARLSAITQEAPVKGAARLSAITQEAPVKGAARLSTITQEDVRDYYARDRHFSVAACTASESQRNNGEIGELMKRIHPEVTKRYYGCGLVAPDELLGLDVLDLGCGVGVDVFLLSKFVGPAGHVIGVDMVAEQLAIANKYRKFHSRRWGYSRPNTMFLKGYIEDLEAVGIPTGSQDVVVSNCVLSLSLKKDAVLKEAARVLRNGGEFFFSDMYSDKPVPKELAKDTELWGEGFSGALHWEELVEAARSAGFCTPVLYESDELQLHDEGVAARLPAHVTYRAATYRLFKRQQTGDASDASTEDQDDVHEMVRVTYQGGLKNGADEFWLTTNTVLEVGDSLILKKELADTLQISRYAKYLDFEPCDRKQTSQGFEDCNPFA